MSQDGVELSQGLVTDTLVQGRFSHTHKLSCLAYTINDLVQSTQHIILFSLDKLSCLAYTTNYFV